MSTIAEIEAHVEAVRQIKTGSLADSAAALLAIGEVILEAWITARGEEPTQGTKEGFRLLALHRQGARGDPSFNACRETCRELVYHYNLITSEAEHPETGKRLKLMGLVAKHIVLFVSGKMAIGGLGAFCCAAKPVRARDA